MTSEFMVQSCYKKNPLVESIGPKDRHREGTADVINEGYATLSAPPPGGEKQSQTDKQTRKGKAR